VINNFTDEFVRALMLGGMIMLAGIMAAVMLTCAILVLIAGGMYMLVDEFFKD
jgi:hypothetical protein